MAVGLAGHCAAWVVPVAAAQPEGYATAGTVQAGESLSNFLRRNALLPGLSSPGEVYLPGLVLQRASLQSVQALQKTRLSTALFSAFGSHENVYSALLGQLPVTGRLVLKSTDADYLSLHPQFSPRLQAGDSVAVKGRPVSLLVLADKGPCTVGYQPGQEAPCYLNACSVSKVDQVWLVQPTGEIHTLNVAKWNAGSQVVPMPGAWLLAPGRNSRIDARLASQFADFLATQGQAGLPAGLLAQGQGGVQHERPREHVEPLRDLPVSSSTWGWVGLLQTPTARMRPAGSVSFTASRVEPYSRYSIMLQPFDWLEAGFRYTKITNRLFGPFAFSGDQKFLDKNIDVKARLWKENAWLPEVAVGLVDVGGTALFASEYLVASKRHGNLDASLGLAWGYLGAAGDFNNPLGNISDRFDTRPATDFGQGGKLAAGTYFRGRASLFGGVQWHSPWNGLTLKLEYDGNNYLNEPLSNPQAQRSRFNYGLVYPVSESMNFHLGIERGNTLSVAVSLFENFSTFNTPKVSDPKPLPVEEAARAEQVNWPETLQQLERQTDWQVTEVAQRGAEMKLTVRNARAAYFKEQVERAAEVLHRDLPAEVKWFTLNYENNGADVAQHVVDREQFVSARTEYRKDARQAYSEVVAIEGFQMPYQPVYRQEPERFKQQFSVGYQQVLGGADGLLYQFFLASDTRVNFNKSTWVDGRLAYRLLDNYEKFRQTGSSLLPQVRTNLREYAISSDFTVPHLAVKHMGKLANGHYYGVYAGLLEQMFAGAGAEYLYRPFNGRFAIGVDVNRVRQRGFKQNFELLPYSVTTGHVTAYIDTGIENIQAILSAGQYLAGDRGVTIDLSREFMNGVRMGAFATRTDVSAELFGEGSFDKGIYLSVPFSAFFTKSIPGNGVFLWRPLTRDGGAKLIRGFGLYQQTEARNPKTLEYEAP